LGHWILKFGIYLFFGACILVFVIILGGRASPRMKLRQNGIVSFSIKRAAFQASGWAEI
jgi:hypothetical protein